MIKRILVLYIFLFSTGLGANDCFSLYFQKVKGHSALYTRVDDALDEALSGLKSFRYENQFNSKTYQRMNLFLDQLEGRLALVRNVSELSEKELKSYMKFYFARNENKASSVFEALSKLEVNHANGNYTDLAKKLNTRLDKLLNDSFENFRYAFSLSDISQDNLLHLLVQKKIIQISELEKVRLIFSKLTVYDQKILTRLLRKISLDRPLDFDELVYTSKRLKSLKKGVAYYNASDNIQDIEISGRVWGRTEGSIYAGKKPAETTLDKLRFGLTPTESKEGFVIFQGEAARFFQAHKVDGGYSLIKRLSGQHKSGFGDLIIEKSYYTQRPDGTKVLVVTKARHPDTSVGEELFGGHQSTRFAKLRLRGRQFLIEPIADALGIMIVVSVGTTIIDSDEN